MVKLDVYNSKKTLGGGNIIKRHSRGAHRRIIHLLAVAGAVHMRPCTAARRILKRRPFPGPLQTHQSQLRIGVARGCGRGRRGDTAGSGNVVLRCPGFSGRSADR